MLHNGGRGGDANAGTTYAPGGTGAASGTLFGGGNGGSSVGPAGAAGNGGDSPYCPVTGNYPVGQCAGAYDTTALPSLSGLGGAVITNTTVQTLNAIQNAFNPVMPGPFGLIAISGGSGGAGPSYAANGNVPQAGGGGGAGVIVVSTPLLSGTGTFQAAGGDAGVNIDPTNYNVPWAGGGGGGIILVHCNAVSGPLQFQVNGGISIKHNTPPNGLAGKAVFV